MRAALVICLSAALFAFAGPTASQSQAARDEPGDGLCGVIPPIDPLLGCTDGTSSSSASSDSPPSSAAPGGSGVSGQAGLQRPVEVVSEVPRYLPGVLLVKFRAGTPLQTQQEVLRKAGATVERRIAPLGIVVVRVAPNRRDAVRARLDASPVVAVVERNAVVHTLDTSPNDPIWPDQWGLRTVALPAAWDRTRGSSSVIVGLVDTGVDMQHPDLAGAVLPGFDLVNGGTNPADDEGHGTAVAGVIAARTNNQDGTAGVCWSCSILPVKVLGADGTGDTALVAAGIVKAVDAGAQIVNLSLGGPSDEQTLDDAVSYAIQKGVIVVAAAGNSGSTTSFYPAAIPGVLSVAGTDPSNHLYAWSSYGSWVNVAAPGCNDATAMGGGYEILCGTSSATPVVSGLAALALSLNPAATRDQIMATLQQTAVRIGDGVGSGRVDAQAALAGLPQPPPPPPPPPEPAMLTIKGSLRPAQPQAYRLQAADGPATATIRFTGASRLTLTIRGDAGPAVTRSGRSPLQLSRQVARGTITIEVGGARRRTAFTLTVTYARPQASAAAGLSPSASPTVLLSATPPTSATATGPQLGAPPTANGAVAASGLGSGLAEDAGLQAALLAAINNVRKSRGYGTLVSSPLLARAAVAHVRALGAAGRFDHAWDDGTPFASWIVRYYPFLRGGSWLAGENLLWSRSRVDAAGAVAAWLRSSQHRRLMLMPSWREIGIGAVAVSRPPGVFGNESAEVIAAEFGVRTGATAAKSGWTKPRPQEH